MSWIQSLLFTGLSLVFLALLFIPLEKAFPAKPGQRLFRPAWILDLTYFAGQYLLWSGLVLKGLDWIEEVVRPHLASGVQEFISAQPIWLQAIEVLLLSDILVYWGHRLQHKWDFLWRFHKVHHSSEHLDWLAAHREHPLDSIYTVGLINLPAILMGFDLNALVLIVAFRGIWAIYIHSNVRIPLGPLKLFIGSPELHHWHHDKERDRGNYANISPLMDVIFGTYVCPPKEPDAFGIKEDFPKSYVGQMVYPMIPGIVRRWLHARTIKVWIFLILLGITTGNLKAQSLIRPLDELINRQDPGLPLVMEWMKGSKRKIEVLPVDTLISGPALFQLQVTTRSPMGAIIYATGGILVDHGWIRILGGGSAKLTRTLSSWNQDKTFDSTGKPPGYLFIADDAIGGFFALNGGYLGKDLGKVYYLAPESLEYVPLEITYTEFLLLCFQGDLELFYEGFRWKNWIQDVSSLSPDRVFNFYPPMWSKEGNDPSKASRRDVPIQEQYLLNMDMRRQLGITK